MVNVVLKRFFQVAVVLAVSVPVLTADTFDHSRSNASRLSRSGSLQSIVREYQATARRNQPDYASKKVTKRSSRRSNYVVQFDGRSSRETHNLYLAAAYLAVQMIGIDRSTDFGKSQANALNNALWSLVYRPSSSNFAPKKQEPQYRAQASRGHRSIPGFNIWKPKPKDTPRDPNVRVPEPSFVSALAFNALALALLGFCLRRRGVRLVN